MKTLAAALLCAFALAIPAASAQNPASNPSPGAASQHRAAASRQRNHEIDDEFTAVLNALVARGYTGIADVTMNGKMFDASVLQQGRHVVVSVDPSTGQIQERG